MKPAIETKNLTKRYKDVTAVDALNLTVEKGELFALLGVNGAGKTTTVKLLCGLLKPTKGEAFLQGYSILTSTAGVKSIIGVSPQETAVAPNLTVRENLMLMCTALARRGSGKKRPSFASGLGWHRLPLKRRAGFRAGGSAG